MDRAEIARSFRRVLMRIPGPRKPSAEVVVKAGWMIREGRVRSSWSAIAYPVEGDHGTYDVFIVFDAAGYICRYTCTCEAGRAGTTCSHLIGALASADHLGYRMEKP